MIRKNNSSAISRKMWSCYSRDFNSRRVLERKSSERRETLLPCKQGGTVSELVPDEGR